MTHQIFNSFDILSVICTEIAAKNADFQDQEAQRLPQPQIERNWDDPLLNQTNFPLLACSKVSRTFREACLPFIFKTITLGSSWHLIETRMDALKSSPVLMRYVRTVRFFPQVWQGLDIVHTRYRWIFRDFATILSKLSLLRALAITTEDPRVSQLLQQSFTSTQFVAYNSTRKGPPTKTVLLENVTDLSLDDNFQFLVPCCPNVKRLCATEGSQLSTLLNGLKTHPMLESFTLNGALTHVSFLTEIYYEIPNIAELYLPRARITLLNYESILDILCRFPWLRRLHFGAVSHYLSPIPPLNMGPATNTVAPSSTSVLSNSNSTAVASSVLPTNLVDPTASSTDISNTRTVTTSNYYKHEEAFVQKAEDRLPTVQVISIGRRIYSRGHEGGGMNLTR